MMRATQHEAGDRAEPGPGPVVAPGSTPGVAARSAPAGATVGRADALGARLADAVVARASTRTLQRWPKWPFSKGRGEAGREAPKDFAVSGPSGGRPAGEPPPEKVKQLSQAEFMRHPGRRRVFAEWLRGRKAAGTAPGANGAAMDLSSLDERVLAAIAAAAPFVGWNAPTLADGQVLVPQLRGNTHPAVQRLVGRYEDEYAPFGIITRLEDAVADEAVFAQRHGGRKMLSAIAGHLFNMGDGPYNMFSSSPDYARAMALGDAPPVPARAGRRPLGSPAPSEPAPRIEPAAGPGVRALREQLGGVIGQVAPGGRPPRHRPDAVRAPTAEAAPPEPVARITLAERRDPRATERKVMEHVARGEPVPPELLARLAGKMSRAQTASRGRQVTGVTEAEYEQMVASMSATDRKALADAAKNYTADSARINAVARGQDASLKLNDQDRRHLTSQVSGLDAMFARVERQGLVDRQRIVYRRTKYGAGQAVPYGTQIKVGDVIGDKGYVSTSENRQFLQEARDRDRAPGARFVMFTIIGAGGLNVSGAGPYTNAAGLEARKGMPMGNRRVPIPGLKDRDTVGQAEILFARNSLFRIDSIAPAGEDIHVVATRVLPGELGGRRPKDAFGGGPIALG